MASKQSIAKERQNYRANARTCSNCEHYKSKFVRNGNWTEEKDKHCGIGEFAVKKMAVCDLWAERKE